MYLGTTDEVTTCDCCGKTGLKKTVAIGTATGVMHFGVVCAAKRLGTCASVVKAESNKADIAKAKARLEEENVAEAAARRAKFVRYQAALDSRFPHLCGDRIRQVQALRAEGFDPMKWFQAA